jgi:hypothetical protein
MKKKIIIGSCVAVLLLGAAAWWVAKPQYIVMPFSTFFQPPEMAMAQYSSKDVVGDLGGVPVTIPKHFAEYVEYDGDPGFGEKRLDPAPVRTHESKLRSFGFEVRYPDMVGLSTPELRQEKRKASIYKTMWISVGITTGEHYPGDGFLDRFTNSTLNLKSKIIDYEDYEKLPDIQFGLEVYSPKGIDVKTGIAHRNHDDARDMYVSRDESGKVQAVIVCSNRPVKSVRCKHRISLDPRWDAAVDIHYRRQLLSEWKKIQESVIKVVERFEVNK